MNIKIQSNLDAIQRKYKDYNKTTVKRSVNKAINDSLKQTRTQYVNSMLNKTTGITKRVIKGSVVLTRSTLRTLLGTIAASDKPISLKYYGARETKSGVSAKIQGKRWNIPGGFKIKKLGGNFYKRTKDKRIPYVTNRRAKGTGPRKDPRPIKLLTGPPVPLSITQAELQKLKKFSRDKLYERIEYHVKTASKKRKL